jgi:hypothetical protein
MVAKVEWVGVNKDVMYRSNIGSVFVMLFLWRRVLGGAEAWILQVGELSTEARQPQIDLLETQRTAKCDYGRVDLTMRKSHMSPRSGCAE